MYIPGVFLTSNMHSICSKQLAAFSHRHGTSKDCRTVKQQPLFNDTHVSRLLLFPPLLQKVSANVKNSTIITKGVYYTNVKNSTISTKSVYYTNVKNSTISTKSVYYTNVKNSTISTKSVYYTNVKNSLFD